MIAIEGRDQARRLVLMVGVVVLGLAVALGVFIHYQPRDLRPPEDVPRALAMPALYATMGLLSIIGALQRRPVIVAAAGLLCLVGAILSIATIEFAVPGVLLILLGSRIRSLPRRHRSEALVAAAAVLLVVSAAIALLGMTEGRCWQATGSLADPTYSLIPCGGQAVLIAGGQNFASGFDSGALTTAGGLVESVLLLGAVSMAAVTGRTSPARPCSRRSIRRRHAERRTPAAGSPGTTRESPRACGTGPGRPCSCRAPSGVMARSRDVATWDARVWVAGLIGCDPSELSIRSTDAYGTETQIRYERGGEPVARLTVKGPVQSFSDAAGQGHRAVTAQLGAGTYKVHNLNVPESDEIVY